MPGKLKLFLILLLSIFATAGASVFMTYQQGSKLIVDNTSIPSKQLSVVANASEIIEDPERAKYQNIPLASINSPLQGSDPGTLALNFLDDFTSASGRRRVEVSYPQHNQALVMVTQSSSSKDIGNKITYRLEMNSFGRSLLASSPPIWQIVWVGSQVSCKTANQPIKRNPAHQVLASGDRC